MNKFRNHIPQFGTNLFRILWLASGAVILCTKYMYRSIYETSFAKFRSIFVFLHAFYRAAKRVEDATANNQKSVVRNCGMWVRNHRLQIYSVSLLIIFVLVASIITFLAPQKAYRTFNRGSTAIPPTPPPTVNYTSNTPNAITLNPASTPTIPHPTPTIPHPTPSKTSKGCGVTKNSDGSYHFSWLHVSGGKIVDENNCHVTLVGLNTAGLEFGDALGGDMTQAHIQQLHHTFHMNLWRVAINVSWWNDNDYVPDGGMHYQDWIKQQIQWMKQNGNYVEIDPTNYATMPPCGGSVTFCIAQDTANTPAWTEQHAVDATAQFWQSVVPLYSNDPAILYDALNEPYPPAFRNFHSDLNQLINGIQQINPKALVFVYNELNQDIADGTTPDYRDYRQPNLVYDWHIYDDPSWAWQDKLHFFEPGFRWTQQHNHAVTIGEWGDLQLASKRAFADAILNLVKTRGFATSYYNEGNMMNNGQLTDQGTIIQQEYASLSKFP